MNTTPWTRIARLLTTTSGLYVKEIARVAKTYEITTHILMPADAASSIVEHLKAHGIIVELIPESEFRDDHLLASSISRIGAYLFPSHDEANVVYGQGTVALELEEEVQKLLDVEAKAQDDPAATDKGKLDAIISVMGNGSTLSGICMATQGTGTRIFGAETISTFSSPAPERAQETPNHYWPNFKPMGALPWSIFTSPSMLSAVFSVSQNLTVQASDKLFEQHGIRVRAYDAAPLGLVLYGEDFRHFAEKEAASGRVRNIGIILRSDFPESEDELVKLVGAHEDADLERFLRNWRM